MQKTWTDEQMSEMVDISQDAVAQLAQAKARIVALTTQRDHARAWCEFWYYSAQGDACEDLVAGWRPQASDAWDGSFGAEL